jgi:hypothetical protein
MAAKIIRHPRTGKPIQPKKRPANGAPGRATAGRQHHRGYAGRTYPEGQGPGGYAGEGEVIDEDGRTVVVCEAPKKKEKFPWGTVLLTGVVTTVGVIFAHKAYDRFSGDKTQANPSEGPQRALLDARDYLLLTAPGAENAISRLPQQPQYINAGPSQREIDLMEREAQLRERMAEMEGFMAGQQASQQSTLASLMQDAEDDD